MPPDGVHVVRQMRYSYAIERFDALRSYPYVGFVDDDDLVHRDAINACVEALETTGAGIAFTSQEVIDIEGLPIEITPPAQRYFEVAMHPQPLHHFALLRRSAVDDSVLASAIEFGIGIDWLMKAYAALKYGAVHVPMVGYQWRIHGDNDCKETDAVFRAALPKIRKLTVSWMRGNLCIPTHTLQ